MCLSLCPNKPACEWWLMLFGKFSQFDDFILVLLRDQHFCRLLNFGRVEKSEVCIWAMRKLKEAILTLDVITPLLSSETAAWPPGVQDRILVMRRPIMRYSSPSSIQINPELCFNSKDYLPYPCSFSFPFSFPFFSFPFLFLPFLSFPSFFLWEGATFLLAFPDTPFLLRSFLYLHEGNFSNK